MESIIKYFEDKNKKCFDELDIMKYLLDRADENPNEFNYEIFIFQSVHSIDTNYSNINNSYIYTENYINQIKNAKKGIIEYCKKRIEKDINPILKSGYCIFIIIFEEKITNKATDYKIYLDYIKSVHDIIANNYYKSESVNDLFLKLLTGLKLSISRNIKGDFRENIINDIILLTQKNIKENRFFWYDAYDIILYNNKIDLSDTEKYNVIEEYDKNIQIYMENNTNYAKISNLYDSVLNITKFYKTKSYIDKAKAIVNSYYVFVKKCIEPKDFMVKIHCLSILIDICDNFQFNEISNNIKLDIQNMSNNINDLKGDADEFNLFINMFIDEICNIQENFKKDIERVHENIQTNLGNDIRTRLEWISNFKIVNIADAKDFALNLVNSLCGATSSIKYIFDKKLRKIASCKIPNPSIQWNSDSDLAELRDSLFKELYKWHNITYIEAVKEIIESLNSKDIIDYIKNAKYIYKEQFGLIELAIQKYYEKDYISFIHLITPQIEAILRNILELNGELIYKYDSQKDGFNLITLGSILSNEHIKNALDDNFIWYLKMFLGDSRALNLRNKVCHGLCDFNEFGDWHIEASRCLQILLKLSKI